MTGRAGAGPGDSADRMTGRPVALVVLDGWGEAPQALASVTRNAIAAANTPNLTRLRRECPMALLGASGVDVGLKPGQMGDSNVGHLNLGAGRVVYQDVVRIDTEVAAGRLGDMPVLRDLLAGAARADTTLHLMGLLSDGGVHSHQDHLAATLIAAAAAGVRKVRVHAFLDGRDVPPRSAAGYLVRLEADLTTAVNASAAASRSAKLDYRLASLMGRYYAMDRDNRWERIALAYGAITGDEGPVEPSWRTALQVAYDRGESDEFVRPVRMVPDEHMSDGDAVFFLNFRADRARQLTAAFTGAADQLAAPLRAARRPAVHFATMTRYEDRQDIPAVFAPLCMENTLGEVVAQAGMRQLRLAETEKYAHVTFFFSGGREERFPGEDRILVPSPGVATYDLQPEMAAPEVTRQALLAIETGGYDLIVMNYANGDMVGHTGDFAAAVKAVETVDRCLGEVVAAVAQRGGATLIVSDHGNCEAMYDAAGTSPHTAHTNNPVPAILCAGPAAGRHPIAMRHGILADVAPTVLELLRLPLPSEMTGRSLIIHSLNGVSFDVDPVQP